jgi:hypothetical protein
MAGTSGVRLSITEFESLTSAQPKVAQLGTGTRRNQIYYEYDCDEGIV